MADVVAIIRQIAAQLGVPADLALAIAKVESGLNPAAIGDSGHSVGLYQLNDRGEGYGLTVAQRQDPSRNAGIALAAVAKQLKAYPAGDPGQIAALAQRPANPGAYALAVDTAMLAARAGGGLAGDVYNQVASAGAGAAPAASGSGGAWVDALTSPFRAIGGDLSGAFTGGTDAQGQHVGGTGAGDWIKSMAISLAVAIAVLIVLFVGKHQDAPSGGGASAIAMKLAPALL